jgi:hypothetical protein
MIIKNIVNRANYKEVLIMFGWGRQAQERREQEEQEERLRLEALSEKELMIELMIELKRIDRKIERVRRTVITHSD